MDDEVLLHLQSSTLCLDLIAWEGYSDRNRKRDETRGDEGDRDRMGEEMRWKLHASLNI